MFNWLFGRRAAAETGDGRIVYAVGDVHGRIDLLEPLLGSIFDDAGDQAALLVMLGDYVDRGESSRDVVERLANGGFPTSMETVFLKGNHEQALLDFLERPEAGRAWTDHGGFETLLSYGVRPPSRTCSDETWSQARDEFASRLPDSHRTWLDDLKSFHVHGQHFFAHAGVDKSRSPDAQDEQTLLWTRRDFLDDRRRWPLTVVHGHTPGSEPVVAKGRIGVDTGAYATGRLSAARLEGAQVRFLSSETRTR